MHDPRAADLLETWFGSALQSTAEAQARNRLWFRASSDFDAHLRDRFGELPSRILAGDFEHWKRTPEEALARVIALDQIPRNIHRGTTQAFHFDAVALASAKEAVDNGYDHRLAPLQAVFLYLPFEHAEDGAMQNLSVQLFRALSERAPAPLATVFESYLDYALRHAQVIARFGRFPHRNEILGRVSTPEEDTYLRDGGQRF